MPSSELVHIRAVYQYYKADIDIGIEMTDKQYF